MSTLTAVEVPYDPALFRGVRGRTIALEAYPSPYWMLEADADAALLALLAEHPLVRIPVPPDLRQRERLFQNFDARVTRAVNSQPPHIDHPHAMGDPRRTNVLWAERARVHAATYFLPLECGPEVARQLAARLRACPEAWAAARGRVERYRVDPRSLSRYTVPAAAVDAFEGLVRRGEAEAWDRLSDYGQTTALTRILGNTGFITVLLPSLFATLEAVLPGSLYQETWAEPCVVLANDTRLYHGRFGQGESGDSFFRTWLAADSRAAPQAPFGWWRAG